MRCFYVFFDRIHLRLRLWLITSGILFTFLGLRCVPWFLSVFLLWLHDLPILSVVIKWRSATNNKQVGLIYLVFYKIQIGCSEGGCGACTVMVSTWDDKCNVVKNIPVNSCLRPLCSLDGSAITTVEGESLLHTNGTRFLVCIFIPLYHVLATIFFGQESVVRKPCIPCKKPWPNIMEHSVVFALRDGW